MKKTEETNGVQAQEVPETTTKVASNFVRVTYPNGNENYKEEQMEITTFATAPASVYAGMGMTVNIGNYESLRIDAGVTLPCYKEEVDSAHRHAYRDWETDRKSVV